MLFFLGLYSSLLPSSQKNEKLFLKETKHRKQHFDSAKFATPRMTVSWSVFPATVISPLRGSRALDRPGLCDRNDFFTERQLRDPSCLRHDPHLWDLRDPHNRDIDHLISVLQLWNSNGFVNIPVHADLSLRHDRDIDGLVDELRDRSLACLVWILNYLSYWKTRKSSVKLKRVRRVTTKSFSAILSSLAQATRV